MKKLLLTTAVALMLTTGIAHAQSSPFLPSMRGLWCYVGQVGKTDRTISTGRYVRGKCREKDSFLEIGAAKLEGWEWGCSVRKGAIVGQTYRMTTKCGGEGVTSDEEATLWFDGRYLMYRKVVINEFPEYETMMCRGHRSTPPDDDVDPVVLTMLTFDEAFRIAHTTRQGKTYVRGDQYRDVRSWMGDDNDNIVSWSGVWKRTRAEGW